MPIDSGSLVSLSDPPTAMTTSGFLKALGQGPGLQVGSSHLPPRHSQEFAVC